MLNKRIKAMRCELGISQTELAIELGVSKQCVSNWENDNILPSIDMLKKLSKFFKVSCDYLLGIDDRAYIDATGLTETQRAHICLIIKDLLGEN